MLKQFLFWLFGLSSLTLLEKRAAEIGKLTLQQVELADGLGWSCYLRARQDNGGPKYAWSANGETIAGAIAAVLEQANEYKIGERPLLPFAPKLGGRRFDE